jgi:Uma2 family endonuclease
MATTETLLTADEFERLLGDRTRDELIDGEPRERPPTVHWHGEVESNLVVRLGSYAQAHGLGRVSCGDLLYVVRRNPDRVRAADITFIRQQRLLPREARQHIMEVIPDLVVESLSKGDTVEDIHARIDDWLHAGLPLLWIVDPFRRTVTIYRPGDDPVLLGERATLAGDPVVPGFRCPVAELFAEVWRWIWKRNWR